MSPVWNGRQGHRRAGSFLVASLLVALALFAAPVHADPEPPPSSTVDSTAPGSTQPGSTQPGSTQPGSTVPGGVTTTLPAPPATSGPGGFGGPPPTLPGTPPEPPMPDPSPQVRVLLAQLTHQSQQNALTAARGRLAHVESLQGIAEQRVTQALHEVDVASGLVAASDKRLRNDALAVYISPTDTGIENLITSQPNASKTRSVLLTVTIDQEKDVRRRALALVSTKQQFVVKRRKQVNVAAARTQRYSNAVAVVERRVTDRRRILNIALKLSPDWSLPIQGASVFTAPELAAWFAQHGVASHAQASMGDLATFYIDEGKDEHIRGDMAFAQSVLETGSFTNDDTVRFNNFAGVGHCDSCATGFIFATPQLGVRAQIQLLKDYSEAGAVLAHPLVDPRLRGPSGCCTTWRALTHTWATNGNYGAKIMDVYRDMLTWLVTERGLRPLV